MPNSTSSSRSNSTGESPVSLYGEQEGFSQSYANNVPPSAMSSRKQSSDSSSRMTMPSSPTSASNFISPMVRRDSASSGEGSDRSSGHSSPIQPPLPPPGFQPPIAFNPAAQAFVRQSSGGGSNSGSGETGSRSRKSREKYAGSDERRSSDPSTSSKSLGSSGSGLSSSKGSQGRPALIRARSDASSTSSGSSTSVSPPSTIPASPSTQVPMRYPDSADARGNNATNQTRDIMTNSVDPLTSSSGSSSTLTPQGGSKSSRSGSGRSGSGSGSGGGSGESGDSGESGGGVSHGSRSQNSLDNISLSIFTASGFSATLNPPPPMRTNSEAWDSVWPATSPYAVPHLPSAPATHSSQNGSSNSGSSLNHSGSGSGNSGSRVSSGSPNIPSTSNLSGSPIGYSLVMSPSSPYPPNLFSTRSSGSGGHKRTPSVTSPVAPSPLSLGGPGLTSRGSPFLGINHNASPLPTDPDSPRGKHRMELSLPHPRSPILPVLKGSPRMSSLARPGSSSSPTPSPPVTPTTEQPSHVTLPSDLLDLSNGKGRPRHLAPMTAETGQRPLPSHLSPRSSLRSSIQTKSPPRDLPPLKSPRPVLAGLPLPAFLAADSVEPQGSATAPSPGDGPLHSPTTPSFSNESGNEDGTRTPRPRDSPDLPSAAFSRLGIETDGAPPSSPGDGPSPEHASPVDLSTSPTLDTSVPLPSPLSSDSPAPPLSAENARPDVDNPYFPPNPAKEDSTSPPLVEERPGDISPPVEAFEDGQADNQNYMSVPEDMDIDDEGLTTLERIFLLSKSEFVHHRIFISRVIGEWVEDVDPCETVEYVLPLLNSLGTDEDEAVREALAPSLHKVLWFYYSTCRLLTDTEDPVEQEDDREESPTTVTITADGIDVVPRPTLEEISNIPVMEPVPEDLQRAGSSVPVVDSNGSTATLDSTPGSVFSSGSMASTDISEVTTSSTQISDTDQQCYFNTNYDEDDEKAFMQPVRKSRPAISVQTFTPLIGSLLMSHSSLVCESAKAAIIGILARLRNIQLPNYDPWPERHLEIGQSKTYYAQTGVHIHDMLALSAKEKKIIQDELLNAIVIGMARLDETQSPYDPEEDGDQYVEGDGAEFGEYPWGADGTPVLIPEHDDAFGAFSEDGDQRRASSPELTALVDRNDALTSTGQDADVETAVADEDGSELPPLPAVVPPQVIPDDVTPRAPSPTDAPGNPDLAPGSSLTSSKRAQLYPQTEYDSPNAPPIDHRSYSEVAAYDGEAMEESAPPPEMNGTDHLEELSVEASHGRLLSMNLIAAVVECGVLAEEDVATRLFVPEVCRMRFDESYAVRREAALAMVELLKVVPQEVVMESLLTLFDAFAVDENPHVRQAACLALPALTRHLHPYSFKKEHTLKAIEGFCGDETSEIQNTALEVLGELIYAFHDDDEGLPNELITYFLGPPRVKKELVPEAGGTLNIYSTAQGLSLLSGLDDEGDYRQIVCAFNFPAVALTAGRAGWPLLREFYLDLAEDPQVQVRRSLAASLHEMAKIVGDEISAVDLVPFFLRCLESEYEIRERLWENLHVFLGALDQKTAWPLIHKIGQLLVAGQLSSWRLRERLMQSLPSMAESMIEGQNGKYLVVSLLREGLIDKVAAVRDAAIHSIPSLYATTRKVDNPETRNEIDEVLRALSHNSAYRQRRTFVRCMETFMDVDYDHELVLARCIPELLVVNEDPVVDVRFALANYVRRMCGPDGYCPNLKGAPEGLITIANSLHEDESFDIRSLVADLFPEAPVIRRTSVASTSHAPSAPASPRRPLVHRTSSTGSAGSTTSIPANLSMRSPGTPILDEVNEGPESVLQLENVPSPLQSPKVIPGYELHGVAFPSDLSKEEALSMVHSMSTGDNSSGDVTHGLGLDQDLPLEDGVTSSPRDDDSKTIAPSSPVSAR